MTEAALRTTLCIYMTTETLLRPMLHRLSPNEGRMHFFALLPHQLTKYSNTMAMVSMAGHIFVAIWHAVQQATGLANTDANALENSVNWLFVKVIDHHHYYSGTAFGSYYLSKYSKYVEGLLMNMSIVHELFIYLHY